MYAHVTDLLKSFRQREQRIELLRYELLHHANVSGDELIDNLNFSTEDTAPNASGNIFYIMLNYQKFADRLNTETVNEIAADFAYMHETGRSWIKHIQVSTGRKFTIYDRMLRLSQRTGYPTVHGGLYHSTSSSSVRSRGRHTGGNHPLLSAAPLPFCTISWPHLYKRPAI